MKTYLIDVLKVVSRNKSECGKCSIQANSIKDLKERIKTNPTLLSSTFNGDGERQDYDLGNIKGYYPMHILSVDKTGQVKGYTQF